MIHQPTDRVNHKILYTKSGDQMSAAPYLSDSSSTSGGRYHSVITCPPYMHYIYIYIYIYKVDR